MDCEAIARAPAMGGGKNYLPAAKILTTRAPTRAVSDKSATPERKQTPGTAVAKLTWAPFESRSKRERGASATRARSYSIGGGRGQREARSRNRL